MITLEQKIEMFKSDLKENEDLKKENVDLKYKLERINDILKYLSSHHLPPDSFLNLAYIF